MYHDPLVDGDRRTLLIQPRGQLQLDPLQGVEETQMLGKREE